MRHQGFTQIRLLCNVHSLIHLKDDIVKFDSTLSELSAFPFENHMQVLKKYVRKANSPLRRYSKLFQSWKTWVFLGQDRKLLPQSTQNSVIFKLE